MIEMRPESHRHFAAQPYDLSAGDDAMSLKTNELDLKVLYNISQIIGQALDLDRTLEIVSAILAGPFHEPGYHHPRG